MKILVATDSFKGTLSPMAAAKAIREGLYAADPSLSITLCPLSDGGEGFLEAISQTLGLTPARLPSLNVSGNPIQIEAGLSLTSKRIYVESATIIGFERLPEGVPLMERSTAGVGHTVAAARATHPDHHIFLSLGGSTTMDCGLGAAHELGCSFYDVRGAPRTLPGLGAQNSQDSCAAPSARSLHGKGTLLCDVNNMLTGRRGAAPTFGPQKGANEDLVRHLDTLYGHLLQVMARARGQLCQDRAGFGAAGGIGAMLSLLFDWPICFGTDFLWENLHLDDLVTSHDLVITGEGRFDSQSLMGKATGALVTSAQRSHTRLLIFSGSPGTDPAPYGDLFTISRGNIPPLKHLPRRTTFYQSPHTDGLTLTYN